MFVRHLVMTAALVGFGVCAPCPARVQLVPATPAAVSQEDRATLEEFARRVRFYVELHQRLARQEPVLRVTHDPGEIRRAVDALGTAIRAARVGARQGDFFTPEVSVLLRRAIGRGCAEGYGELWAIVTEDLQVPLPAATLHGRWPEGAPLPTMPPDLLAALPPLPPELEYRFVSADLVLRDRDADLILDILADAIPIESLGGSR